MLGLIQVMQHLDNIDEVGSGIAVAFVATVYGVGSANLFFLPSSGKLRIRIREEQIVREMTLEGVISILEGMNPRMLETSCRLFEGLPRSQSARSAACHEGRPPLFGPRQPRTLAGFLRRLHHPAVRILRGPVRFGADRPTARPDACPSPSNLLSSNSASFKPTAHKPGNIHHDLPLSGSRTPSEEASSRLAQLAKETLDTQGKVNQKKKTSRESVPS